MELGMLPLRALKELLGSVAINLQRQTWGLSLNSYVEYRGIYNFTIYLKMIGCKKLNHEFHVHVPKALWCYHFWPYNNIICT